MVIPEQNKKYVLLLNELYAVLAKYDPDREMSTAVLGSMAGTVYLNSVREDGLTREKSRAEIWATLTACLDIVDENFFKSG